jgi:hypothetical protein
VDYIKLANQYSSSDKEVSKERESTDKNANGNSTRKERKNGRAIPKKGQKEKRASEKSKPNGKSGETAKGKRKVAKRKKKKANRKVRAEAESTDDSDKIVITLLLPMGRSSIALDCYENLPMPCRIS